MQDPDAFDVDEDRNEAPAWLVDLTVVLGLAAIVLAVWLFTELRSDPVGRHAEDAPVTSLPVLQREATGLINKELAAMRSFLPGVYGPMRTDDASFIDRTTGVHLIGADELEDALLNGDVGFSFDPVRTTDIEVAQGDVAIYGTTWGLGTDSERRSAAIVIVTLEDGKIVREVVMRMAGVRATDDLVP
jgi:hypothetical protein